MTSNLKAINHNCPGTSLHEISHLQMKLFTKEKFDDGVFDVKQIYNLSGVKNTFADFGAKMLGDVDPYQRIIQ